jgi:hypothetical protein
MLDQRLKRTFDVLRGGAQKLGKFFKLYRVLADVGEDAQEFVQGNDLGPEVGHPANV